MVEQKVRLIRVRPLLRSGMMRLAKYLERLFFCKKVVNKGGNTSKSSFDVQRQRAFFYLLRRRRMKENTFLAQIGNRQDEKTGAISLPLHLSTTYAHQKLGESTGYDYTRTQNPTREVLEESLAYLEHGAKAVATSSGMSGIQLALAILPIGSKILATKDIYGGSYRYFQILEEQGRYSFTYFDDQTDFEELISEEYQAVFVESPTNPLMKEFAIEEISTFAPQYGALVIVDNTFLTPILQKPLDLGADIVVHSATKFLAGVVVAQTEELGEQLAWWLNTTGAVLAPFDCWLLIRSLKTLSLRVKQQQANAQALVPFLKEHPAVSEVLYPGRGGMISLYLQTENQEEISRFLASLTIFRFAESLGGVESLITYPATQTHADIPKEIREAYGVNNQLLRLSIGIEEVSDLEADLRQSFTCLKKGGIEG